jgi:hypothetical protein
MLMSGRVIGTVILPQEPDAINEASSNARYSREGIVPDRFARL